MFLNLHGGELVILVLAALLILGPSRLPEYAAKLGQGVRYLRDLAEGAKGQLKDELGPGFDEIDWRQLDPRQYDPRRIVRDALSSPAPRSRDAHEGVDREDTPSSAPVEPPPRVVRHDPTLPTPFDVDAT